MQPIYVTVRQLCMYGNYKNEFSSSSPTLKVFFNFFLQFMVFIKSNNMQCNSANRVIVQVNMKRTAPQVATSLTHSAQFLLQVQKILLLLQLYKLYKDNFQSIHCMHHSLFPHNDHQDIHEPRGTAHFILLYLKVIIKEKSIN